MSIKIMKGIMRRYKIFFSVAFIAIMLASCQKLEDVGMPDFSFEIENDVIKAGETVRFRFSGNPDVIFFYSGEFGCDYDHRDGRIVTPEYGVSFDFQLRDGTQENQASIMLSTKMPDDMSSLTTDIIESDAFDWQDITDKFSILRVADPDRRDYEYSGLGNISEYIDPAAPSTKMVFTVRYTTHDQSVYGGGGIVRYRFFTVKSIVDGEETPYIEHPEFGWQLVSTPNKQPGRSEIFADATPPYVQLRNGWGGEYTNAETRDYGISIPVELPREVDLGPDRSIPIRGINDVVMTSYEYTYEKAGTYDIVFVAKNININGEKSLVLRKTITVEP